MFKLKKIVAYLIVIMLLGNMCYAATSEDLNGMGIEDEVQRLSALGIMKVDASKGFQPNELVTRAEFIKIIIRALNLDETAKLYVSKSIFSDISETDASSGYINLAYELGLISGVVGDKYAPEENISYDQAAKIIMSALGYKDFAEAKGGYPSGYVILAAQEGITKGIQGKGNYAISRAMVAKMIDNALDVPMIIQSKFGVKSKIVKSGTDGTKEETLLTGFNIDVYKAQIISVDEENGEIRAKIEEENGNRVTSYGAIERYKVLDGVSVQDLEFCDVTIWVNSDDIVIYIKKESETKTIYDFIKAVNDDESATNSYGASFIENVTLENDGSTYEILKDSDGNSACEVYFNNEKVSSAAKKYVNAFVKVILNEDSIIRMDVYEITEGGLITGVDSDNITFTRGKAKQVSLKDVQRASDLLVIIDGKLAKFNDLSSGMVMDYWMSSNENDVLIVASTKKVEGKFNSNNNEEVEIGDKIYKKDNAFNVYYSVKSEIEYLTQANINISTMFGAEVAAYIDARGKIRYINTYNVEPEFYGVAISAWYKSFKYYIGIYRDSNGMGKTEMFELKLKNSPVNYEDLKLRDKDGEGVYKFYINKKKEIEKIESINWRTANDVIGTALTVPTGIKHFNKYVFYGVQFLNPTTFIDQQVTTFDNDYIIKFKKIKSYSTTPNFESEQYINVKETKMFSLVDEDGEFNPTLMNYIDNLKGKSAKEINLRIEASDPSPKIMVITNPRNNIRSDSKKYGYIINESKLVNDNYKLTIHYMPDNKTKTYLVSKNDIQEAEGYYCTGTEPKKAEANNFVIFVEQGKYTLDDNDEPVAVSTDGQAKILKVYDLQKPWSEQALYSETPHKSMSLNDGYDNHVYKIEDNAVFKSVYDVFGNVTNGEIILANTSGDYTLSGNRGNGESFDTFAAMSDKMLIYNADKDLNKFTPDTIGNINTFAGNGVGDKIFYVVQDKRIRMLIYQKQ